MQQRWFVEVGLIPQGGQQVGWKGPQADFFRHPRHQGFIPVPQGHAAEMVEEQQDRSSPEQHDPPTPGHACGADGAKAHTVSQLGDQLVKSW
jgi:hypothetical protein